MFWSNKISTVIVRFETREANRSKSAVSVLPNISAKSLCSWTDRGPRRSPLAVHFTWSNSIAADSNESSAQFQISWRETCCSTTAMCHFSSRIYFSGICSQLVPFTFYMKMFNPFYVLYIVYLYSFSVNSWFFEKKETFSSKRFLLSSYSTTFPNLEIAAKFGNVLPYILTISSRPFFKVKYGNFDTCNIKFHVKL